MSKDSRKTLTGFERVFLVAQLNFGERYRRTRFAWFFAIFEPIGVIAIFTLFHGNVIGRAPFGSSTVLFYATGVLPFYLFFHTSVRARKITGLTWLPTISRGHYLAAYFCDELLSKLCIMTIVFASICLLTQNSQAVPKDPALCFVVCVTIAFLGLAVGVLNGAVCVFYPGWIFVYSIAARAAMILSGVVTVVDLLPVKIRDIFVYNPLTHAVIWYRSSFYTGYPTFVLDVDYYLAWIAFMGGAAFLTLRLLDVAGYRR